MEEKRICCYHLAISICKVYKNYWQKILKF